MAGISPWFDALPEAEMNLDALVRFYDDLKSEDLARFTEFYTADAYFKDPFNEVRGVDAVQRIFAHMFGQVSEPRFHVTDQWQSENGAVLLWDFTFRMKRGPTSLQIIHGATHLRFAPDGRVNSHRDYWDAAEELYEKLPLIGVLMRFLRRVMST
jgi:steroid delta-isomerase